MNGSILTDVDVATFNVLGNGYATDNTNAYYAGPLYTIPGQINGVAPASFQILSDGFSKDINSAYFRTSPITGSDPDTFVKLAFGYSKDATAVYHYETLITGADPATFTIVNREITFDDNQVFYNATELPGVSPTAFSVSDGIYVNSTDKVYLWGREIIGANPASFRTIPETIFGFTRDDTSFYDFNGQVAGSDPDSFVMLDYAIGKDNNNVYLGFGGGTNVIAGADTGSFEVLSTGYFNGAFNGGFAKDANNVYFGSSMNIVTGADPASFVTLNEWALGKDNTGVYYKNTRIADADPGSFSKYHDVYYKDNRFVYIVTAMGDAAFKVIGADPASFEYLIGPFYRDNDQVFRYGMVVDGADPNNFDPYLYITF